MNGSCDKTHEFEKEYLQEKEEDNKLFDAERWNKQAQDGRRRWLYNKMWFLRANLINRRNKFF